MLACNELGVSVGRAGRDFCRILQHAAPVLTARAWPARLAENTGPGYTSVMRLSPEELRERAAEARETLAACVLCGHRCGADRAAGELGKCGCGAAVKVGSAVLHPGEEPCLGPQAGTVFFSGCNLSCVYCQNWQISREGRGMRLTAGELAGEMLRLRDEGAANVELVSPTPWVPQIIEALAVAAERGLDLPVVCNTGGYDCIEALRLMEGVADVYLPDMRYSWGGAAERFSDAGDYVAVNRAAVLEMMRQVGDLEFNEKGQATRGLIIRLLVLPNGLAGVRNTLAWMAGNLSTTTWFSLLAQYAPAHKASAFPEIARPVTGDEYRSLLALTDELGFENFYTQSPESRDALRPDFDSEQPFSR